MAYSAEIIAATREDFARIDRECITAAAAGEFHVNNLKSYIADREASIRDCLAGKHDHTLTFAQHAHFLATGECVPLLGA